MSADDEPLAGTIEELDAPPPGEQIPALHWERVVGLLLVLGLVGFGLAGWWDQQSRAGHYRAGSQAAATLDWEAARAEFAAAAGYADADTRRAAAAAKLATRDRQYALATAATGRADWVGVLQALQPLQPIAPHYRDSDALQAQALTAAATEALSGAVALRLEADPPGLYRFEVDGWRRLPDSDASTRVRATCPAGGVLYDVAAWPGTGTRVLPPLDGTQESNAWAQTPRQFRLDAPAGTWQGRLTVDPDPGARYVCTAGGVWTLRSFAVPVPGDIAQDIRALDVRYQDFAGERVVVPALPGPAWHVIAVAPQAGLLLLLDSTAFRAPTWRNTLYLAQGNGSGRRLLAPVSGPLDQADLSPDGRYALIGLSEIQRLSGQLIRRLFLLDTAAEHPLTLLVSVNSDISGLDTPSRPYGLFLQQAPRIDQVLLSWPSLQHEVIRLLDPRTPGVPLRESQLPGAQTQLNGVVTDPATGALLLIGMRGDGTSANVAPGLEITADNQAQPVQLAAQPWSGLWLRAGHLVALLMESTNNGPWTFALHSQVPTEAGGAPANPLIYTATGRLDGDAIIPMRLAANWLIYSDAGGTLHGRTYDGALDLPLPWAATGFPMADLWEQP